MSSRALLLFHTSLLSSSLTAQPLICLLLITLFEVFALGTTEPKTLLAAFGGIMLGTAISYTYKWEQNMYGFAALGLSMLLSDHFLILTLYEVTRLGYSRFGLNDNIHSRSEINWLVTSILFLQFLPDQQNLVNYIVLISALLAILVRYSYFDFLFKDTQAPTQ